MGIGLINQTSNISIDSLLNITNTSKVSEILINVNNVVYNGWFYFIMLLVVWWILFLVSNSGRDQPLNSMLYSGVVVSILSILLRAVSITKNGVSYGLLSDFQMWLFPIITIFLAMIVYATGEK